MAFALRDFVISALLFHTLKVVTSSSPRSFGRIERSVKFDRWKNIREHQSQRDKSWKSQTIRYWRLRTFRREPGSGKLIVVSNYKLKHSRNWISKILPISASLNDFDFAIENDQRKQRIYIVYILRLRIRLDAYVTENSCLDMIGNSKSLFSTRIWFIYHI